MPTSLPRVKSGDIITADLWNSHASEIERKANQGEPGPKGDQGDPGIRVVASQAEADLLPVGSLYVIADVAGGVSVAGFASGNVNAASFGVEVEGAQPGDRLIVAVNTKAYTGQSMEISGFSKPVTGWWKGTEQATLFVGDYSGGRVDVVAGDVVEASWVAVLVRGASAVEVGDVLGREDDPAHGDNEILAPAVNVGPDDLALGVFFERTTATESPDQVTVSEGWEKLVWQGHGENIQTVLVAKGGSGDVVASYPNPQPSNGVGVQVVARG